MLVTKAIIKKLPAPGNNIYRVRIPIFEQAGVKPAETNDSTYDATLCYIPGTAHSLEVEDVVYVTFEDNEYSNVVIIGKLFLNDKKDEESALNINARSIEVKAKAVLPKNTTIGSVKGQELISTVEQVKNLTGQIEHVNNRDIRPVFMPNGMLRIYLQNFKATDVGANIDLYRTTKSGSRGYKHPKKYGYGVIATKARGRQELDPFPDVPDWMPNDGFIQTRWTLTSEILTKGYFEIDWLHDWLPLAVPDEDLNWVQVYGVGNSDADTHESVKIKFGFVRDENLAFLSTSTIRLGKQRGAHDDEVVTTVTDPDTEVTTYLLSQAVIYKSIS